ncbi:MAG: hypothetical protein Q9167_006056 [Letrouitia subvulpina]
MDSDDEFNSGVSSQEEEDFGGIQESGDDSFEEEFDEDDPDMGFSQEKDTLKPPKRSYEIDFKVYSPTEIISQQDQQVQEVSAILGQPSEISAILLRHLRWNKERLIEAYMDKPEQLMENAGLGAGEAQAPKLKVLQRFECTICFDDSPSVETYAMKCGHRYCVDCYRQYLGQKIREEGEAARIQCPTNGCSRIVDSKSMDLLVATDLKDRYLTLLTRTYVDDLDSLKWCPAPNCEYAVECSVKRQELNRIVPTVACHCNHRFCFGCTLNDHQPTPCTLVRMWLKKCEDDSETANWISANTKECPKCSSTIEKNGGCNHMTCRKCKYEFCWMCMGLWSEHGTSWYNCNRFEEKSGLDGRDSQARSRQSLERYLHYYNRYANHEQSAKLDKDLYFKTEKKMTNLQTTSGMSWIEVQFLQTASQALQQCRQTLKWTYAFAYYLARNNLTEIFEDNQKDLEMAVESLSQMFEKPVSELAALKVDMMDKTSYCNKRRVILLEDTSVNLKTGEWKFNVDHHSKLQMMAIFAEVERPLYLHVFNPPFENYFYADDNVSCQAVLASPLPRTDHESPALHRLLFAWPAGNSGAAVFFKPVETEDSDLGIKLKTGPHERILDSIKYESDHSSRSGYPSVGVSGLVEFSNTAILSLAILGSVRSIRDYTEGHGILNPKVQAGVCIRQFDDTQKGIRISRVWFDGKTTTQLTFAPIDGATGNTGAIDMINGDYETTARFAPGLYSFEAHLDFPQIPYMHPTQLLKPSFHQLTSLQPDPVRSLSFLCTSEKILARAWRFLTYFGRDSMITFLLLNRILSEGEHGAIETVLSAVLERVNHIDGSVCHEENIGDYPAAQAALHGEVDSEPQYDYKMTKSDSPQVDTDFFLPIAMKQYFVDTLVGRERLVPFLRTRTALVSSNAGKTYGQLLKCTCKKILDLSEPFSEAGGQTTYKNLIALKDGQPVGQWRDSNDGLGGGRYPYDVNTALMPAALRAIAELARAGAFQEEVGWNDLANRRASAWETLSLNFFTIKIPRIEAQQRLERYKSSGAFLGPSRMDQIDEDLYLQAVALRDDGSPIEIMHTDACFRLLLLPHLAHSSDPGCIYQHLLALDVLTSSILRTFPAGLCTSVGVLIANPACSSDPSHARAFTTGAYHGTVVWAWNSFVRLAKGLEVQLCAMATAEKSGTDPVTTKSANPNFYNNVRAKMKHAYRKLWDLIEANARYLSEEVWSWRWDEKARQDSEDEKGGFVYVPLSHLPTPDGAGQTESNARQLWSLAFLALERRRDLET